MSKPPKLSLKSIVAASAPSPLPPTADVVLFKAPSGENGENGRGTLKERAKQLSVYLEPQVYDQLRDIAHAERTKIHPLMLEALDLLFKNRGAPSIRQVGARAARS